MSHKGFKKPCANYVEAWTTFRATSNENNVIADWLFAQKAWPKKTDFRITDFGCGDGKVVAGVVRLAAKEGYRAKSITLLDPDEGFLSAASQHVRDVARKFPTASENQCPIDRFLLAVKDAPQQCFETDALLLVHVVYLMRPGEFARLLGRIKPGVPLYVILDHPNSVFSQLWKETACEYLKRVEETHALISELPKRKYSVKKSKSNQLVSRFEKSALNHHLTGPLLVSMLCYNDKLDIVKDVKFKKLFWGIVNKEANGYVKCRSVGYEIVRKAKRQGTSK
jgi:SAM-dependent methyltransferase